VALFSSFRRRLQAAEHGLKQQFTTFVLTGLLTASTARNPEESLFLIGLEICMAPLGRAARTTPVQFLSYPPAILVGAKPFSTIFVQSGN